MDFLRHSVTRSLDSENLIFVEFPPLLVVFHTSDLRARVPNIYNHLAETTPEFIFGETFVPGPYSWARGVTHMQITCAPDIHCIHNMLVLIEVPHLPLREGSLLLIGETRIYVGYGNGPRIQSPCGPCCF